MTRRKTPKNSNATTSNPSLSEQMPNELSGKRRLSLVVIATLIIASLAAIFYFLLPLQTSEPPMTATTASPVKIPQKTNISYVGASACVACHQSESEAWKESHHDLAIQEANAETVLGDFNNTTFQHHAVESTFFKRDTQFFVRTDGPDGKLNDYAIKYTFGVTPLQQYLIEFPGGRLQALGIAWDSRPQADGGQRWFHIYDKEKIDHTNQLHWTGRYQNWNLECAECHSTHLKKAYDASTDSYKTSFKRTQCSLRGLPWPSFATYRVG